MIQSQIYIQWTFFTNFYDSISNLYYYISIFLYMHTYKYIQIKLCVYKVIHEHNIMFKLWSHLNLDLNLTYLINKRI